MGRILGVVIAWSALACAQVALAQDSGRAHFRYGIEAGWGHADSLPSWLDGSVGKFVNDGTELQVRGYAEHAFRLTDTVSTNLVLEAAKDELGPLISATEAFLLWRPIPQSYTRYRFKLGAFYPDVSLENIQPGWRSPYTINYSAINSWVAEELRVTGVEMTAIRKLPDVGPAHRLILQASVFGGNDPAGSILAWRGWSLHDRQSRFGDRLPLQQLPLNRTGEMFEQQAAVAEPFKEVDDRLGFYTAAEWRVRGRFSIKGLYYDNGGDPEALENGQYAWDTRFWSVGVRLGLPKTTLLAQWMKGNTGMGPLMSGKHAVDNNFDSYYFLVSKRMNKHRFSARFDWFRVDDVDAITVDDNNENGTGWTLSHRYRFSDRLSVSTEWATIETNRPGWAFNGFDTKESERQFQIRLRYTMK